MSKKINRQLIQNILSKGDGVKSVSSEAVDWVISVAEHTARQLATSGRRTPAGRLMAPKMDPGLQSRTVVGHMASETPSVQELSRAYGGPPNIYETIAELVTGAAPGSLAGIKQTNPDLYLKVKAGVLSMRYLPPAESADESGAEWSDYNDWQQAVRTGATKLKFEEWKEQRK